MTTSEIIIQQETPEPATTGTFEKIKSDAIEAGRKASDLARRTVENESLVQNGLMVSLAATVLTSLPGLHLRRYHPYAGAALAGFALLHLMQNKNKRARSFKRGAAGPCNPTAPDAPPDQPGP
ncbi:MAG: hypothetical protein HQM03_03200 [Magnetococcales bacterium]|nr:hypothetical protein [Magnetococcales bacterium]